MAIPYYFIGRKPVDPALVEKEQRVMAIVAIDNPHGREASGRAVFQTYDNVIMPETAKAGFVYPGDSAVNPIGSIRVSQSGFTYSMPPGELRVQFEMTAGSRPLEFSLEAIREEKKTEAVVAPSPEASSVPALAPEVETGKKETPARPKTGKRGGKADAPTVETGAVAPDDGAGEEGSAVTPKKKGGLGAAIRAREGN